MKIKMKVLPKECPFCHSMPAVESKPLWSGTHGYHGHYEYYVRCDNDKCKIQPKTIAYNDIYDMTGQDCIDKAIEDWNSR